MSLWKPTNQYSRVCFTANLPGVFQFEDFTMESLRIRLNPVYMVAQPEKGLHKHWQGYVEFAKKTLGNKITKIFAEWGIKAHLEVARGNAEQNLAYCSKESSLHGDGSGRFIFGEPKPNEQGRRCDLEHMVGMVKEGASDIQLLEENPSNFLKHHKAFALVRNLVAPRREEPSKLFFVWGPTGNGKTTAAMSCVVPSPEMVEWEGNRFLQGYSGSNTAVLFDDFDWAGMNVKLFLRLVDRWPMTVGIKGGFSVFAPKTIIFTSNDSPKDWWPKASSETKDAVWRRMEEFGEIIYLEGKLEVAAAQNLLTKYFAPPSTTTGRPSSPVGSKTHSESEGENSEASDYENEERRFKRSRTTGH